MSFLGGRSNANTGSVNYEKMEMAVTECVPDSPPRWQSRDRALIHCYRLDTVTDFFNRMVSYVVTYITRSSVH